MSVIDTGVAAAPPRMRAGARIDALIAGALAAGIVVIVLLYAALFVWSARIDAISAEREVQLVRNGIASQIREAEDAITAIAQWDEAVARTNAPLDRDWVTTNIGAFLDQSLGVEGAILFDAHDLPIYAMRGGEEVDSGELPALSTVAGALLTQVRVQETARGGFPAGDGVTVISTPIRASAAYTLAGEPYLVTATLIQPDFGLAMPDGPRGAVLLSADRFDAAFDRLAAHYLLSGATLAFGGAEAGPGQARAFLETPDGAPVATILWRPEAPGRQLLSTALPFLSIATVTLVAGGLLALAALRLNLRSLRRTMEELVAARDAARIADRAKSQFLAFMSHEIRTPLNGVIGMAQIMLLKEKDPARREQLDIIRGSGEALLTVLNDILDLSKIEADRMELTMAPFDLAATTTQACAAFRGVAEAKGLTFALHIADSAHGEWIGDGPRLRQILTNLVANAVKFTDSGRIAVGVRIAHDDGETRLEMSVEDTGIGISAVSLPRLFERFVQADSSHSRRHGGTGLGLAISQDLARLMGGQITVHSREGQGSTFTVEAPLRRADGAEAIAA